MAYKGSWSRLYLSSLEINEFSSKFSFLREARSRAASRNPISRVAINPITRINHF